MEKWRRREEKQSERERLGRGKMRKERDVGKYEEEESKRIERTNRKRERLRKRTE